MKPPHESNDDIDRLTEKLLGSFREDVAPSHAKKATLAVLGLAGTATASTISVSAGAASALSGMAKVSLLVVAKAVAGGALVGAVVVGTSSYLQTRGARETRAAATSGAPSGSARPVAPTRDRASEAVVPPPKASSEGEPPASAATTAVLPRADTGGSSAKAAASAPSIGSGETSAPAPTRTESSPPGQDARIAIPVSPLAREIALLDESRAALARGNASEALRILDRYAADFERGALAPEATVLRIEALVERHEPRAARDLAEAFERAHPNDSHLSRIRSLLARAPR